MSSRGVPGVWLLVSLQLAAVSACAQDVTLGLHTFAATGGARDPGTGGTGDHEAGGTQNHEAGGRRGFGAGGLRDFASGGKTHWDPERENQTPENPDPASGVGDGGDDGQLQSDDEPDDGMREEDQRNNVDVGEDHDAEDTFQPVEGDDGLVETDAPEDSAQYEDAVDGLLTHESSGGADGS